VRKINWIILLCCLVSILLWLYDANFDFTLQYLAFSGENLLNGRIWTVFTALFVHADIPHLLGNMLFLYVFGNTLEQEVEAKNTFIAFFVGGVVASVASLFFYDLSVPFVGASGAIFTLTAIVMLVKPLKFSFVFFMPQGLVAILYFAYNVAAIHYGFSGNVAYIAHAAGFLVGVPFGIAWSKNWIKNLLISIGLLAAYVIFMSFLLPSLLAMAGLNAP
jgi:membrane associated rhomboid family serine protease